MVKKLSKTDKAEIVKAVEQAEQLTSAELAVIVAHSSDTYQGVALSTGLAVGTMLALVLWHYHIVMALPQLLVVQLVIVALFRMLPFLNHVSIKLMPKHLLHGRAALKAAAEYLHFLHHLPAGVPAVLIYVSLAERYVHIHTSRSVRAKINQQSWQMVVSTLAATAKTVNVKQAIIHAAAQAGDMLKLPFPPDGRTHSAPNVTEI